jgi:hypothetical protein
LPNPFEIQGERILIVESDVRGSRNMQRRARGLGALAVVMPNCSAAIRMVGDMAIQEVWLARGMRDPAAQDLIALLARKDIPVHMVSALGLMPLAPVSEARS